MRAGSRTVLDGVDAVLCHGEAEHKEPRRRDEGAPPEAAPRPQRGQSRRTDHGGHDDPPHRGLAEPLRRDGTKRQYQHGPPTSEMPQEFRPWRMKEMTPVAVRERLRERATLLVPVGTTEQHGPHLPLGCDTLIVERLADDLSAAFVIPRAPAVEYGVQSLAHAFPGGAALRRKTLHRVMNELIEAWEHGADVTEFLILTAQGHDPHLEALSTIRTDGATVLVADVFALDFGDLLETPGPPAQGGELDTSLMLYLFPELVQLDLALGAERASAQKGERLYRFIFDRVSRCLVSR
jgi:creatinine amidohydrolase